MAPPNCVKWIRFSPPAMLHGFGLADKQGIWVSELLWTSNGTADVCDQPHRLYCVQVTD